MAFPIDRDGTWLNPSSVQLDASELRRADATMFAGNGSPFGVLGGIVMHGDDSLKVTVDGSDVVSIKAGAVVIPGNSVLGTGPYRFALGTDVSPAGSLTARHATNPRIDLVVARQMDTDVVNTHGAYTGRFQLINGTPAGTPTAPSLPDMAVELARITVPPLGGPAASVDLTHRTFAAAIGAELKVTTSSMLPAVVATGQRAVALDTLVRYRFDGATWLQAEADNLLIQRGTATVTVGASTSDTTAGITFSTPYSAAPIVVASQAQGSSAFYFGSAEGATTTGFTAHASKTGTSGSSTIAVKWIAVGLR